MPQNPGSSGSIPVDACQPGPPPKVDLSERTTSRTDGVAIALAVVVTAVIALRFYARIKVQRVRLMIDDWLILSTLVRS